MKERRKERNSKDSFMYEEKKNMFVRFIRYIETYMREEHICTSVYNSRVQKFSHSLRSYQS